MVNGVEANSVFSNFVAIMNADLDHRYTPKLYKAKGDPLKDPDYPDKLRKLYKINDDNTIHLSSDLLQQKTNEIPVGAVWLQAAIDQKRFKNTPYANKNLVEIIDYLNKDNISDLLSIAKADWQNNEKIIEDIENSNSDIAVPLEQVYLVAAKRDIDSWLKVISCCEHKPAGILLYDHNNVRLENFLSDHKGDNDKLTAELRSAISPNDGYIEYSKILGREFTDNMRAGNKNHVIAEKFLDNRHIIKKINNKITIV